MVSEKSSIGRAWMLSVGFLISCGAAGSASAGVEQGCCVGIGDCRVLTPEECASLGGQPLGEGVLCDASSCQLFHGCCFPSGLCENINPTDCLARGGTPLPDACEVLFCTCAGDYTGDRLVDLDDIAAVLSAWGVWGNLETLADVLDHWGADCRGAR